jgi:hypothetical protein
MGASGGFIGGPSFPTGLGLIEPGQPLTVYVVATRSRSSRRCATAATTSISSMIFGTGARMACGVVAGRLLVVDQVQPMPAHAPGAQRSSLIVTPVA